MLRRSGRWSRAAVLAVVALLAWAGAAAAQTPSPFAYWQNSAGIVLAPLGGPIPQWRVTVGGGSVIMPNYEGSDRYPVQPSPVVDIRYRDLAFLSVGDGLGVNLLRGDTYRAGIAVGYDLGRDQHLSNRLNGLGNISPTAEPRLFAEIGLLPVVLTVDVRKGIGGHEGIIGDVGAYVPVPVGDKLVFFIGPSVTLANQRYMQAYFGVSTAQAQASRAHLPFYTAAGGLKNGTFGVTAIYSLTPHWLFDATMSYERLAASAANSPIVLDRNQIGLSVDLCYEF